MGFLLADHEVRSAHCVSLAADSSREFPSSVAVANLTCFLFLNKPVQPMVSADPVGA